MTNEVKIVVTGDGSGAKAAFDTVNKQAGQLGSTIKGVGQVAAGILTADLFKDAARGAKNFISSTVSAASNLNESANAVNQVFGQSAKQVSDWGKQNAESFGLSQRAFNEAVTPMGALLKNTGLSMQDTTKYTLQLTQRAADMASVFNTSVPDALEAVQAGLRGESDPLEKYGVSLTQAKVQAEALNETHKQSASQLTQTELATARLNLIMGQTSSTAGDFQRTSGGLANSQRIASAQFEDAKAKLGAGLLPALADAAKIGGDVATVFAKIPGPLQTTAVVVAALGAGFIILAPRIIAAKEALSTLSTGALSAETRMGSLARTAGKVGIALVAVQTASAALGHSDATGINTTTEALKKLADSGDKSSAATKHLDYDLGTLGSGGLAKTGNAIAGFAENISGLGSVMDESLTHAKERIESIDAALAAEVQNGHASDAATQFNALAEAAKKQGISLGDLKAGLPQYEDAIAGAGKATSGMASDTQDAANAAEELNSQVDKLFGIIMGVDEATLDYHKKLTDLTQSIRDNGRSLDETNPKGQENYDNILSTIQAIQDLRDANIANGMSMTDANAQYDSQIESLRRTLTQMGLNKQTIDTLINKYKQIPSSVNTSVNVNDNASGTLRAISTKLDNINGRTISTTVVVDTVTGQQSVQRRSGNRYNAHGGVQGAASGRVSGALTWVGEQGPELVNLPVGSTVYPSGQSKRMAADNQPTAAGSRMSDGGGIELSVAAGGDTYVAALIQNLIRNGVLTISQKAIR